MTKKHPLDCSTPPLLQCHKVFPDWLNKNTQSAKVPVSHLGQQAPPLKGKAAYFSGFSASPFSPLGGGVCKHGETGDSPASQTGGMYQKAKMGSFFCFSNSGMDNRHFSHVGILYFNSPRETKEVVQTLGATCIHSWDINRTPSTLPTGRQPVPSY